MWVEVNGRSGKTYFVYVQHLEGEDKPVTVDCRGVTDRYVCVPNKKIPRETPFEIVLPGAGFRPNEEDEILFHT